MGNHNEVQGKQLWDPASTRRATSPSPAMLPAAGYSSAGRASPIVSQICPRRSARHWLGNAVPEAQELWLDWQQAHGAQERPMRRWLA
jgi:hypothetical protein